MARCTIVLEGNELNILLNMQCTIFVAARWTIILEGNELNILYCFPICYFNVAKLYIFRETNNITVFGKFSRYWEQKLTSRRPSQEDCTHATEVPY